MNRRIAFPFLTLSDAAVEAAPWEVSLDGEHWMEAGEFLPDWDASCDIHLRRSLRLNQDVTAADLALSIEDLSLAVGVRIGTGQGRLPRLMVAKHTELVNWENPVWCFESIVEARMLSQVLDLQTQIVLGSSPEAPSILSPMSIGDRLWTDGIRVQLEGEELRFPIETADLDQMLGNTVAAGAPWYLHWSPRDWNRDFHGAVRLYLNKDTTEFLERIKSEDPQTLQLILADIMSQVCERFVAEDDLSIEDVEAGSLAAQAATWLRKAWPGKDVMFIRSVLESRPSVFRSAFLALAELREP